MRPRCLPLPARRTGGCGAGRLRRLSFLVGTGARCFERAMTDCRKSLVRHDLLNGRDMDLISQSLDFVARSHPRLVLLEAGL